MRRLAVVLVVVLLVTTGCTSFLPWSSESHPSSEPTTQSVAAPPGASSGLILDSERLIDAHRQALADSPYRLHVRVRPTQPIGSSRWSNATLSGHIAGNRMKLQESGKAVALKRVGRPYVGYSWNGIGVSQVRRPSGGLYWYSDAPLANVIQVNRKNVTDQLTTLLSAGDYLANGTVTRNGTTLRRYSTTGSAEAELMQTLNATVLVDKTGMIHALTGSFRVASGEGQRVPFAFQFWEVSEPPTKPAWVDQVPQIQMSPTDSGVVRLNHTGGATIPGNTTLSFSILVNESIVGGQATFPTAFTPGDTAYLTATNIPNQSTKGQPVNGTLTVNRRPAVNRSSPRRYEPKARHIFIRTNGWRVYLMNSTTQNAT